MDVPPTVVPMLLEFGDRFRLSNGNATGRKVCLCRAGSSGSACGPRLILGARILEEVHNHHNFAWREKHDGEDLWVVGKGATPAFPGSKRGFVGGSMGDDAVIIDGIDSGQVV